MKKLAIIPARGGSKRIPRKNIKPFLGKPIIAYTIETALGSGLFDEVMVSTDDEEIAATALGYGAAVPFIRSADGSNDTATISEVTVEVLEAYRSSGRGFDVVACLYATAPFITADRLKSGMDLLESGTCDSVFGVRKFAYPILRSLKQDEQGFLKLNWPEHLNTRSQDLPEAYHDAGQFCMAKTDAFKKAGSFFTERSKGVVLSDLEVRDIDTEEDWAVAEQLVNLRNR